MVRAKRELHMKVRIARGRRVEHPSEVTPLNEGFFHLERIRKNPVGMARARTEVRKQLEG
jgi:hypothetical protein